MVLAFLKAQAMRILVTLYTTILKQKKTVFQKIAAFVDKIKGVGGQF